MKTFILAGAMATAAASSSIAGPMTPGERQRLVAHLEMTEAWLESEVSNLSDAQLKFKMTPTSWSVEEVVMHLAIAEPQYRQPGSVSVVPDDLDALAAAHRADPRGQGTPELPTVVGA